MTCKVSENFLRFYCLDQNGLKFKIYREIICVDCKNTKIYYWCRNLKQKKMVNFEWMPYAMVLLGILFICSCVYIYKHKEEVMEMAGIDAQNVPGMNTNKRVKKQRGPHPNAKKSAKILPQHQAQQIAEEEEKNRPKEQPKKVIKREQKQTNVIRRNKGRSELPITTNDSAAKCMMINDEGFLSVVTKDRMFHLFFTEFLHISPSMLTQHFELDKFEVTNAGFMRSNGIKIVYTENVHKKLVIADTALDEESKFYIKDRLEVENVYKSTCTALVIHPQAEFIGLLVDNNKFVVYDVEGKLLTTISFEGKKIMHAVPTPDHSRIFFAVGASIEVYDYKKGEFKQFCTVPTKASITSMAYAVKTGELVVATSDGLLTVYTSKIQQNKARNVWEIKGIRLVVASVYSPTIAIVSGKAKLTVVNLKDGKVQGALEELHEGEVNFLTFSNDDAWIFCASRSKPNIESYRFNTDKK